VLVSEFKRGMNLVAHVEAATGTWEDILQKHDFFRASRHFLLIQVRANGDQVYRQWMGWVESKLRFLVRKLEATENLVVRPWPEWYNFADSDWEYGTSMFIALDFDSIMKNGDGLSASRPIDLRSAAHDFVELINGWSEREKYHHNFSLGMQYLPRKKLPNYVLGISKSNKRANSTITETGVMRSPAKRRHGSSDVANVNNNRRKFLRGASRQSVDS